MTLIVIENETHKLFFFINTNKTKKREGIKFLALVS